MEARGNVNGIVSGISFRVSLVQKSMKRRRKYLPYSCKSRMVARVNSLIVSARCATREQAECINGMELDDVGGDCQAYVVRC